MILITGAAGFIGSNLVAALNDAGRDDLILCDWIGNDGRWENLAKRSFVDLRQPDELAQFLATPAAKRIEMVLHMGAVTDTMITNGDLVVKRNYQFSKMLWTWCAKQQALLVYASSAATYGDGTQGFDDDIDFKQLKRLRPLNLYAWSKHAFDVFAQSAESSAPPQWYGLKLFNVFGPNEFHKSEMSSVVCKNAARILSGQPTPLFKSCNADVKDGGQSRDFIHVDDVCAAALHFAKGSAPSGLYNVGTGIARSFRDFLSAAYRAAGHAPNIEYVSMPDRLRARYQYFTEAKVRKLRASGFGRPFLTLDEGVSSYVSNFLAKEDRYR